MKGYEVNTWMGFFAPAGTPKDVIAKIEEGIKEAVQQPDVRQRLEMTGMDVRNGTAGEMRNILAVDIAKWRKLVKEQNIKVVP